VQLADLVALSLLPHSRKRLNDAVGFADAADGSLEAALAALGDGGTRDGPALRGAADEALSAARRAGVAVTVAGSGSYPELLARIADPPLVLWHRGGLPPTDVAVAVIGSRAASPGAREVARRLGAGLARHHVVVVSGLARGCDGEAHQGALDGGGVTIAVLGCGADVIYPSEHHDLAYAIACHGAVASEFPPGTPPLPHHFPLRNRIISGLSRAVVVVEAGEQSGSLITAGCALEQGREVMVVPGPVLSGRNRGAHSLLRDGATLVESADDILAALATSLYWTASASDATRPGIKALPNVVDDPVLAALDVDDGQDLDALVRQIGLPATAILARLSELELSGQAARQPGGRFVRLIRK
jgi:DNA processing protein